MPDVLSFIKRKAAGNKRPTQTNHNYISTLIENYCHDQIMKNCTSNYDSGVSVRLAEQNANWNYYSANSKNSICCTRNVLAKNNFNKKLYVVYSIIKNIQKVNKKIEYLIKKKNKFMGGDGSFIWIV